MSFEDFYEVDIDSDEGLFVIIRNNGTVSRPYSIDEEPELFFRILDGGEKGEIEIVELS